MAAKLDQTAESICGPKWAIARDLSVYESGSQATTTKGKAVSADRGPPMVRLLLVSPDYVLRYLVVGLACALRS